MTAPKILLDPVDFDALHLSALEFGGIGEGREHDVTGEPFCKMGHAYGLEPKMDARIYKAGLEAVVQDKALQKVGVVYPARLSFAKYIRLLNIDIKETA